MGPCPQNTDELDQLISQPTEGVVRALLSVEGPIAVLGAGGKMGFHLCLMLQKALRMLGRDDEVTAVSRFSNQIVRERFRAAGIAVISADLSNESTVQRLPDFENLFFLAGVKFGTDSDSGLLERMNVHLPRLIARRYQHARIVALSSGCVYSFSSPESGGSTETSDTDPPGAYARSCLGRESAFTEVSEFSDGLKACLIRLNYSIDLRYGVLVDIAQKVRARQPLNLTTGHVNVIWQGDAVAHIIQSLPHCDSPPLVLNITGPETLSVRKLAEAFAGYWNLQPEFESTESDTAWLSNASRSHALFGRPLMDVEQMIQWTVEWLDADRTVLDRPTRFQVRDGRY